MISIYHSESKNVLYNYTENSYSIEYPCKSPIQCSPFIIDLSPGIFFLEVWGASGGNQKDSTNTAYGGKGGHSSGVFYTKMKKKLYLHLGGHRDAVDEAHFEMAGNYNGGGIPAQGIDAPGGGASDFRKKEGNWNEKLESRILIAGGGGGGRIAAQKYFKGGDGGGLNGTSGEGHKCSSFYGTQFNSLGGNNCGQGELLKSIGELGKGGNGFGTGGGGYHGGSVMQDAAGGGGSGFINPTNFLESF